MRGELGTNGARPWAHDRNILALARGWIPRGTATIRNTNDDLLPPHRGSWGSPLGAGDPMRRVALALLAVGLTIGGLSAVQPRASADSAPGIVDQVSSLVQGVR